MEEQGKGRIAFCQSYVRQLYDSVVKFEELVDDLRVFDTVKDGDDSNVVMNSLKIA